ncbi:MAG: ion transporter [Akkermansiaceae bacterium]|nr:ion transporter [Akkermansiaceae bacterium]
MATQSPPEQERTGWRQRLWEIVFEAETPAGKAFDVLLLWAIGLSVLAVMLDSVESVSARWHRQLFIAEWVFTSLFMLEYFLRIWLVRRPTRYIFSFFGVVDLLSWIPSFVALAVSGTHYVLVIRILRLLRMFRVLKMVGHMRGANIIITGLIQSRAKITVFFFTMLLFAVIIGTVAYIVESGSNSGFNSIPESVYWAIVTITTLGYGDIAPVTVPGKMLAAFCVLTGYCIIAVPTGIVVGGIMDASRRRDETTDACPSCGVHGHLVDAKFCRRCGEKLDETIPPGNTGDGEGI